MGLFRKNKSDKNSEAAQENTRPNLQENGNAEGNAAAGTGNATDKKSAESTQGMSSGASGYQFAPDVKLKECKYCRVMIPKAAKICPNCKMRLKKRWLRNLILVLVLAALICGGVYLYVYEYQGQMVSVVWSDATAVSTTQSEQAASDTPVSEQAGTVETETTSGEQTDENLTEAVMETQSADSTENIGGPLDALQAPGDTSEGADTDVTDEGVVEFPFISEVSENDIASEKQKDSDVADNTIKIEEFEITQPEATEETDEDIDDMKLLSNAEEADAEAFRAECEQVSYKALLRRQEEYLDRAVSVEVTVLEQINGGLFDESIYYFCVTQDADGRDRYYIIRDDRGEDAMLILEGDVLVVYGKLFGDCKLPASLVETRPTVPALSMLYCDLLAE